MADNIITILDETDKSSIETQISNHTSSVDNPHGVTVEQIGAATVPIITTITLSSSSWDASSLTQNVTVVGILEDATKQIINVSPASSSMIVAANSVVYCSGQAADTLIFTCLEVPTEDVVYNVSIQGAMHMG